MFSYYFSNMMKIHACLLMTILLIHDRSPRVGSYAFASLFDRKVPEAMRLVFERDMVTNQPKFCCAYKHVGREILIDERGNCIANPTFVEKAFSNSKTRISDHSMFAYLRGMKACEISGIDHGDGDYER
mmetsp:Transcript_23153/g.37182  ORF Transcript_23153/g.37182 Transcript_23153/m.37182 type:complete len:129 (-) Transcript_23153:92-478(-)